MKISFWLIIGVVVLLAIVMSGLLTITGSLNFAGFDWQTEGDISKSGDFVELRAARSNSQGVSIAEMRTDVSNIDEFLVIAEGDGYVSSSFGAGASSFISIQIRGTENGIVAMGDDISSDTSESNTKTKHFDARVYKLRNNFDGTWSSLESLGVGDIFIVKRTERIIGNPILAIQVGVSNSGVGGSQSASGSVKGRVYNVVVKESAFAVCKADEFWQDKNQDRKPTIDECFNLQTIVLNSEEAIKESFDEKIARITLELEAKNAGLTADIEALKKQLTEAQTTPQTYDDSALQSKINALETELRETKAVLADVQAGDKNIVAAVEAQEKFKKPNFIIEFFNKIIAFFKNLFR